VCVFFYHLLCYSKNVTLLVRKLQDRVSSKELRGRLGLDDIISVLQRKSLRWYGHVLRKEDNDWVKKCMEYEVEGARPKGRPKKTWRLWKKTVKH